MWRGLVLVSFLVCNLRYGCFLYSKKRKSKTKYPEIISKASRRVTEGIPKECKIIGFKKKNYLI